MANKKKMDAKLKAERHAREARTVRMASIVVVLVIAAVGIWFLFPKGQGEAPPVTAACEPFGDIPVATQYNAPEMRIDTSKQYNATFKLATGGEFVIQLYPDKAPITVNNFVFLACKGFYNGVTFHRVIEGFMAQSGDPTGTGSGGPGYSFEDEFGSGLTFDKPGLLAMANAGPNTNGSQFFITFVPTPHLSGVHTIFGEVVEGMDVVNGITLREPGSEVPGDVIESVTISEQ